MSTVGLPMEANDDACSWFNLAYNACPPPETPLLRRLHSLLLVSPTTTLADLMADLRILPSTSASNETRDARPQTPASPPAFATFRKSFAYAAYHSLSDADQPANIDVAVKRLQESVAEALRRAEETLTERPRRMSLLLSPSLTAEFFTPRSTLQSEASPGPAFQLPESRLGDESGDESRSPFQKWHSPRGSILEPSEEDQTEHQDASPADMDASSEAKQNCAEVPSGKLPLRRDLCMELQEAGPDPMVEGGVVCAAQESQSDLEVGEAVVIEKTAAQNQPSGSSRKPSASQCSETFKETSDDTPPGVASCGHDITHSATVEVDESNADSHETPAVTPRKIEPDVSNRTVACVLRKVLDDTQKSSQSDLSIGHYSDESVIDLTQESPSLTDLSNELRRLSDHMDRYEAEVKQQNEARDNKDNTKINVQDEQPSPHSSCWKPSCAITPTQHEVEVRTTETSEPTSTSSKGGEDITSSKANPGYLQHSSASCDTDVTGKLLISPTAAGVTPQAERGVFEPLGSTSGASCKESDGGPSLHSISPTDLHSALQRASFLRETIFTSHNNDGDGSNVKSEDTCATSITKEFSAEAKIADDSVPKAHDDERNTMADQESITWHDKPLLTCTEHGSHNPTSEVRRISHESDLSLEASTDPSSPKELEARVGTLARRGSTLEGSLGASSEIDAKSSVTRFGNWVSGERMDANRSEASTTLGECGGSSASTSLYGRSPLFSECKGYPSERGFEEADRATVTSAKDETNNAFRQAGTEKHSTTAALNEHSAQMQTAATTLKSSFGGNATDPVISQCRCMDNNCDCGWQLGAPEAPDRTASPSITSESGIVSSEHGSPTECMATVEGPQSPASSLILPASRGKMAMGSTGKASVCGQSGNIDEELISPSGTCVSDHGRRSESWKWRGTLTDEAIGGDEASTPKGVISSSTDFESPELKSHVDGDESARQLCFDDCDAESKASSLSLATRDSLGRAVQAYLEARQQGVMESELTPEGFAQLRKSVESVPVAMDEDRESDRLDEVVAMVKECREICLGLREEIRNGRREGRGKWWWMGFAVAVVIVGIVVEIGTRRAEYEPVLF